MLLLLPHLIVRRVTHVCAQRVTSLPPFQTAGRIAPRKRGRRTRYRIRGHPFQRREVGKGTRHLPQRTGYFFFWLIMRLGWLFVAFTCLLACLGIALVGS